MGTYSEAEVNQMLGMSASEIEQSCHELDYGEPSPKLVDVHNGSYVGVSPTSRETFVLPLSELMAVQAQIANTGMSKSEYYRQAIHEKLAREAG